jgi:hypothetical protein
MNRKWLIALYKTNEVKRAESSLLSQNFNYYLSKIILATFLFILV